MKVGSQYLGNGVCEFILWAPLVEQVAVHIISPEEKLLRAIFGEKASDVKDTSLQVPRGMSGRVVEVSVFNGEGADKDSRSRDIEALMLEKFKKDLDDEVRIYEQDIYQRVQNILIGAVAQKGPKKHYFYLS